MRNKRKLVPSFITGNMRSSPSRQISCFPDTALPAANKQTSCTAPAHRSDSQVAQGFASSDPNRHGPSGAGRIAHSRDTHPTVPDAELRGRQHYEEGPPGVRLDVQRRLQTLQRAQQPLRPAAEEVHGCGFPAARSLGLGGSAPRPRDGLGTRGSERRRARGRQRIIPTAAQEKGSRGLPADLEPASLPRGGGGNGIGAAAEAESARRGRASGGLRPERGKRSQLSARRRQPRRLLPPASASPARSGCRCGGRRSGLRRHLPAPAPVPPPRPRAQRRPRGGGRGKRRGRGRPRRPPLAAATGPRGNDVRGGGGSAPTAPGAPCRGSPP